MGALFGGGAAKPDKIAPPPPPVPPATPPQYPIEAPKATGDQRKRAAAAAGYGSLIATGPGGVGVPADTTKTSLLGG